MDEQTTTPAPEATNRSARSGDWLRQSRVRLISALVVLAVVAGTIIWAVSGGGKSPSTPTKGPVVSGIKPVALSLSGLKTLAGAVGQPIYWAGPKRGYMYELRRTDNGNVYIRYLPGGVKAGAPGSEYLTVATYPFRGAYDALKKVTGGQMVQIPGGGIGEVAANYRNSVHVAFPKVDYQIEIYDPSPARALAVAKSGQIQPVS